MIVKSFTVGRFFTNCYVVISEAGEAIVIDPGFEDQIEAERILRFIEENTSTLKLILNTHGHPDHTFGNAIVKERFRAPVLIHEDDAYMLGKSRGRLAQVFNITNVSPPASTLLHNGETLDFGEATLRIMHTPGHTRGGISLIGQKQVFTGDTLFAGSIGRVDLPEGSMDSMKSSLRKLASLPDELAVYPGHGPATTMGEEKRSNPFMRMV